MAVELGPYNILVNAVAPGFMATPMSVVNGVDETDDAGFPRMVCEHAARYRSAGPAIRKMFPGTVVFLASDYCRYMTGQLLVVDGGLMSTF